MNVGWIENVSSIPMELVWGKFCQLQRWAAMPMMNGSLRDCHTSYFIHFAINPIA